MARKLFSCGHVGKGQYCHECERLHKGNAAIKANEERRRATERERRARILAAPVPLIRLPDDVQVFWFTVNWTSALCC